MPVMVPPFKVKVPPPHGVGVSAGHVYPTAAVGRIAGDNAAFHGEVAAVFHIHSAAGGVKTILVAQSTGNDATVSVTAVTQGEVGAAAHIDALPIQVELIAVEAEGNIAADGEGATPLYATLPDR